MGSRSRKTKVKEIAINHLNTRFKIKEFKGCVQCPMKLYCENEDTILYGTGNRITNTIFVLPIYDVKANIGYSTIFTILRDVYLNITSKEITEDSYVTRLIKCYSKANRELAEACDEHCYIHLYNEINSINPTKVIFFGNSLQRYLNVCFNNNLNYRRVYSIYSPAVMFYDNDSLKREFIKQLKQAIYDY